MALLITLYVVAYLVVSFFVLRDRIYSDAPRGLVALHLALAVLALIGFLTYHRGYRNPQTLAIWTLVAPSLVLGFVVLMRRDLKELAPPEELLDSEIEWAPARGPWIYAAVLVPAIWANLWLAFG